METIDQSRVDGVYESAKLLNRAERGMLIAILRGLADGEGAAAAPPPAKRGRPAGARNRNPRPNGAAMPREEAATL